MAFFAASSPFLAQAQNIPASVEGGRVGEQLEERDVQTPKPGIKVYTIEKAAPSPLLSAPAEGVSFTLKKLRLEGVSAYRPYEIDYLYRHLIDTEINLQTLGKLKNAITQKYREDGYILARAIVPPQDIVNGTATIRIIEGRLEAVEVQSEMKLSRRMKSLIYNIDDAKLVNINVLERNLLLLRDLPDVNVTSTIKPGSQPGTSRIVLNITPAPTHKFTASVDNWGTRYLGPIQATLGYDNTNFFHEHSNLGLRYVQTPEFDELNYVEVYHRVPFLVDGLTAVNKVSYAKTAPGYDLKALDVESNSFDWTSRFSYKAIRSRAQNLTLYAEFENRNSEVTAADSELSNDKIRVGRLGATYDKVDKLDGVNVVDFKVSHGLNIFDASQDGDDNLSRNRGHGADFIKFNLDAARLQKLPWTGVNVLASFASQFATHALLSAEEFGFGGTAYGRGYDPSEITGDHGFAGKVEVQYSSPESWHPPLVNDWLAYMFWDIGVVWNKDRAVGDPEKKSAASAGIGLRAKHPYNLTSHFIAAKPLTRPVSSQGPNEKNTSFYWKLKGDFSL